MKKTYKKTVSLPVTFINPENGVVLFLVCDDATGLSRFIIQILSPFSSKILYDLG